MHAFHACKTYILTQILEDPIKNEKMIEYMRRYEARTISEMFENIDIRQYV